MIDELRAKAQQSTRYNSRKARSSWNDHVCWKAADALEDMERRIKAARNVIAYGYTRRAVDGGEVRPINPLKNGEKCEHGRLECEDCIGCYDEALLNALDGVTPPNPPGHIGEGS